MDLDKPILNEQAIKDLREGFTNLREPVTVAVFTKAGLNDQYNKVCTRLITEIAAVDGRIRAEFHDIGGEASGRYGVELSPTVLIAPDRYKIRFTGTPLGEEGQTLVMSLILASSGKASVLSPGSVKKLETLGEKRHVTVYVSPT